MPHRHNPSQNRVLAALHSEELQELLPHLQVEYLKAGNLLAESGVPLSHVYFPIDSAISLFYNLESGESAGVAVIGNEGMFSVAHALGGKTLPYWAVIETSGHVFQIGTDELERKIADLKGFREVLLLYAQASLTQISQTVVCERHHSLFQQLCHHLLLINDKSLTNDFHLTHGAIANMLGVRRESVSEVANELRNKGLIHYNRGRIKLLNRAGLEKLCCECYALVQEEFTRLLGGVR